MFLLCIPSLRHNKNKWGVLKLSPNIVDKTNNTNRANSEDVSVWDTNGFQDDFDNIPFFQNFWDWASPRVNTFKQNNLNYKMDRNYDKTFNRWGKNSKNFPPKGPFIFPPVDCSQMWAVGSGWIHTQKTYVHLPRILIFILYSDHTR